MIPADLKLPSNKKFGFFFTGIFFILASYLFYLEITSVTYVILTLGTICFLITLMRPNLLLPFNKLWMRLGFLLGKVISPIVLGFIFFGLFAPIGLLMKLFGRDELEIKFIKKNSYWKKRDSNTITPDTFKQQF